MVIVLRDLNMCKLVKLSECLPGSFLEVSCSKQFKPRTVPVYAYDVPLKPPSIGNFLQLQTEVL